MKSRIDQFINQHQLLLPKDKVIVGLSGGADSVALLHYLNESGYECIAAHCNFKLRGVESGRDEMFVKELCKKLNITLEINHFDTAQIAIERHISIEMAARELRYEWFEQLCKTYTARAIAVAHHRDDSVETLLLNLIRGTGIRGLTGIAAQNGNIVRPFLCLSRAEIILYTEEKKLKYVTDGTNAETIYLRNKLRLELLPWLEEINPSVRGAIERTSENLRSVEHIYLTEIEKQRAIVAQSDRDKTLISIAKLLAFSEPSTLLFELLLPFGFNRNVCNEIFASLNGISGKTFYSPDFILVKDREQLIIKQKSTKSTSEYLIDENAVNISKPVLLHFEYLNKEDFSPEKEKHIAYFDAERIEFPLKLRHWQQSDWFIPFGMTGKKKVSDYFSDQKFNLLQKEEAWLLCSGNDVVWIVGERSDNRFRVSDQTQSILKVRLE